MGQDIHSTVFNLWRQNKKETKKDQNKRFKCQDKIRNFNFSNILDRRIEAVK